MSLAERHLRWKLRRDVRAAERRRALMDALERAESRALGCGDRSRAAADRRGANRP